MFVAQHDLLQVGFSTARIRLADLASLDGLSRLSHEAYQDGIEQVIRVGPRGDRPGVSKLVRISFLDPVQHEDAMRLGLRWEAVGVTGGLFPVLDGDLMLAKVNDDTTTLGLVASYRPPLGQLGAALDRAIISKVADATARALLRSIGFAIVGPEPDSIRDESPGPPGRTALPDGPAPG